MMFLRFEVRLLQERERFEEEVSGLQAEEVPWEQLDNYR